MAGPACQRTMPAALAMSVRRTRSQRQRQAQVGHGGGGQRARAVRPQPVPAGRRRSWPRCRCTSPGWAGGSAGRRARRPRGPASAGASWRRRPRRAPAPWRRPRRRRGRGLVDEHVDDGLLEAGGHVLGGHVGVGPHVVDDRRLEPAEAEVQPVVEHRPGEGDGGRVAVDGSSVDGRPARVAEAEEPRHLVEGLAGGIVDGLAEQPVPAVVDHLDQHRVAAGHEERDEGQLERRAPRGRRRRGGPPGG